MRCETVLKQLDRYRTGEVSRQAAESLAGHLRQCTECSSELDELRCLAEGMAGLGLPAPRNLVRTVVERTTDKYGAVETDLGRVWIGFNSRGITLVHPGDPRAGDFGRAYVDRRRRLAQPAVVPGYYAGLIRSAVSGRQMDTPRLDLEGLTPFEQKTLMVLRRIPRGEVRPYFWLAREAGNPKAVRAVGTIMARNPVPLLLPCHRVVPAQGGVGNYAFGSNMKRTLLQREGVPLEELEDLARNGIRFLGCKSTGIYCFPTCRDARRMKPENRLPFGNASRAAASGYRPCRHCRP